MDLIYNMIERDRSALIGKLIVAGLHSPQGRDAFAKAYMSGNNVDELAKGMFVDVEGLLRHFGASALNVFNGDSPSPPVPGKIAMDSAFITDDEDDYPRQNTTPEPTRKSLLQRSADAFASPDGSSSVNAVAEQHKAHIRKSFLR